MIPISNLQLYDNPKTIEHINSLGFNRTAASTGETEALRYIENELLKDNINSEVEPGCLCPGRWPIIVLYQTAGGGDNDPETRAGGSVSGPVERQGRSHRPGRQS